MILTETRASGLQHVALATQLLQRARLADPHGGLWEAADVQWWWRTPRASDGIEQLYWGDEHGPVAAIVLTEFGDVWQCDVLAAGDSPITASALWARALARLDALGLDRVEVLVRDDDPQLVRLLEASGFRPDGDGAVTWLDAADRPAVAPLTPGFRMVDRLGRSDAPHPMRSRSGEAVADRLRQCSLYDPQLDLAVEAPDGAVAGYALFWPDRVTGVGLVEPMRVEDAYQRRGLGRALLTEGLERLVRRGARRLKVSYGGEAGRRLYLGAGFHVGATNATNRSFSRRVG